MLRTGLIAALALVTASRAHFVLPSNWPVARLVENLGRHVQRHPEDAEAVYALGRVHAWAFTFRTDQVALFRPPESVSEEPTDEEIRDLSSGLPHDAIQRQRFGPTRGAGSEGTQPGSPHLVHLDQAVRNLLRAMELAPERAETHLSLACVLEAGSHFACEVNSPLLLGWQAWLADDGPEFERLLAEIAADDLERASSAEEELLAPERLGRALTFLWGRREHPSEAARTRIAALLARAWLERAAASFRRAFELARAQDGERDSQPMSTPWHASPLDGLVSYEAGEACLRLVRERGAVSLDGEFLALVESHIQELKHLPRSLAITPLLLSLEDCRPLDALVSADRRVPFDLDGDGLDELWPWIAPEAGWLVWDPEHTGEITSGRQLFGSASGWFFFPDGYRVLEALDDDASGELRGAELAGIAVWFDRDTDGVSDRGEVVPVESLGLVALATEATERVGASLGNPCGVELDDGRVLPTYDWVIESHRP